jgi:hypothetical protein
MAVDGSLGWKRINHETHERHEKNDFVYYSGTGNYVLQRGAAVVLLGHETVYKLSPCLHLMSAAGRGSSNVRILGHGSHFDEAEVKAVSARNFISGNEPLLLKSGQETVDGGFGHTNRLGDLG